MGQAPKVFLIVLFPLMRGGGRIIFPASSKPLDCNPSLQKQTVLRREERSLTSFLARGLHAKGGEIRRRMLIAIWLTGHLGCCKGVENHLGEKLSYLLSQKRQMF